MALASGVCGVGALIAACGSSSPSGNGSNPTGDGSPSNNPDGGPSTTGNEDGGSTVNNTTPGSCASATIPILFSPMYSAFIPGSTAQTFQVPAITNDGNYASWSSSDPTSVQLAPDSTTGGVMITMTAYPASGTVTIFASESGPCGSATLNLTSNLETDWSTGNSRYNDGVAIHITKPDGGGFHIPDGGFDAAAFEGGHGGGFDEDAGSVLEEDGGTACVNCHGPVQIGMSGFSNVAHTPEQTGGFSDSQLIDIIVNGIVPDGGYFDPAVLNSTCTDAGTTLLPGWVDGTGQSCAVHAYKEWQGIHRWVDITGDEQPGIVCYLRSLTPIPQGGSSDFGGGPPGGDGGVHHHHDGGGGPPPGIDSGSPDDSGTDQ